MLDVSEQCDDGDRNSDTVANACRMDCTKWRCGDGFVDVGELCDDGANNSDNEANACRSTCVSPSCGDGVVDANEDCDTGMVVNGMMSDVCRAGCVAPRCGDGVIDTGEACDDGNTEDADSCRNDCSSPRCGDLVVDPGEQCDDGNRVSGDGCQATCLQPICGDGVKDAGEACDDDNLFDNDGCLRNCQLGCISLTECTDRLFCNGVEECVSGVCKPGTPPVLDDKIACTTDRCDEDTDKVEHSPADSACAATAAVCEMGLRTSYAAMCIDALGCQEVSRTEACTDAPSTCLPGAGLDMLLTTYVASCAGSECGAPAATTAPCLAAPPTCDPATRVGIVSRATCNADTETCGSELAERNDCAALDARSCAADGRSFRSVTGQCTPMGSCTSDVTEQACAAREPSCVQGTRTEFEPVCDPQNGCAAPRALPGLRCPAPAAQCEGTGDVRTFVRFEPACADASSCDPDGDPVRSDCAGRGPSCVDGTVTAFAPSCDASGCKDPTSAGTMRCAAAPAVCNPSADGIVHTRYEAACADGASCRTDGAAINTTCMRRPPACDQGVLTRFDASCEPLSGCGAPIPSDSAACPANAPVCNPTPEGFLHISYTPACADPGSCALEGRASMTECTGNAQTCNAGTLVRTQASCSPRDGCAPATVVDSMTCPAAVPTCTEVPNGWVHRAFMPACDGAADCLPQGMPLEQTCITPPVVCADAVITGMTAICEPGVGCGSAPIAALPCLARPSTCEKVDDGWSFTRFTPTCADATTCVLDGVPRSDSCRDEGPVCANGVVTSATATCDATNGCGESVPTIMPCPTLPSACRPVPNGFEFTTYLAGCLDDTSCNATGAPMTTVCSASGPTCVDGVLGGSTPDCNPNTGCATVQQPSVPCAVAPPSCVQQSDGGYLHTRFAASCVNDVSCLVGGVALPTLCPPPSTQCEGGVLRGTAPSCDPVGGCGVMPMTETPCPVAPASCEDVNGERFHVTYTPGCEGAACAAGGIAERKRCEVPPPSCVGGRLTSYEATCSPDGGCGSAPIVIECPTTPAVCQGITEGVVDHIPAAGGCNLEGTACDSGLMPIVQRCTAPLLYCEAGVQHDFDLLCTPGVGCSTPPIDTVCTARAAECQGDSYYGFTWRRWTPACEGVRCAPEGVSNDVFCPGGGTVCTMQGNTVGTSSTVAACDPASGCSTAPGTFVACAADTPPACEGNARVEYQPFCENGTCSSTRVVLPCLGETTTSCDGITRVTRTPVCTGAGVCDFIETRDPCPGETSTTCAAGATSAITMRASCNAGMCGTEVVETPCTGTTERTCQFPSGDIGTLGVRIVGPGCGYYNDCTLIDIGFEECTGETTSACESNHYVQRGPDCQVGACTTKVLVDDDCAGEPTFSCVGNDRYRNTRACTENGCQPSAERVETCTYGCLQGACLPDPCPTCTMSTFCDGNTQVMQTGGCNVETLACNAVRTPCPYGCTNGACNADPCATKMCNAPATCLDESNRRVQTGMCTAGECVTMDEYCYYGCTAGQCNPMPPPCGGQACPPITRCDIEGPLLLTFAGLCSGQQCGEGAETNRVNCEWGCSEDACRPSPCEGVTCNDPAVCIDQNRLRKQTGLCNPNSEPLCTFDDTTCEYGCAGGECNPNPCDNTSCDAYTTCLDEKSIRTYTGACTPSSGCVYNDGPCAYGCNKNNNTCNSPPPACECEAGKSVCSISGNAAVQTGKCDGDDGGCVVDILETCANGCTNGVCDPPPCNCTKGAKFCDVKGYAVEYTGQCVGDMQCATQLIEECKYGCEGGVCSPNTCDCMAGQLICDGTEVYKRTGECGFEQECLREYVRTCTYGCINGACMPGADGGL